ncbi:CAD, partial [Symbiodinium necroappetens]
MRQRCQGLIAVSRSAARNIRAGKWQSASWLLGDILKQQGLERDAAACSLGVKACARGGHWAMAVKVLHHTRCLLPEAFDDIFYSSVVDSCGKGFVWDHALGVLGNAKHYSLQSNVIASNSAIATCSRMTLWQRSMSVWQEIRGSGLQLLDTSFVAVLSASAAPLWQKALQWLELVGQEGVRWQTTITNCAIASCSVASAWKLCMSLLLRHVDIFGWTAAISSNSCSGAWEKAVDMLFAIGCSCLQPTYVTFNALTGASAEGDSLGALPWFLSLTVLRACRADAKICSSLISSVTTGTSWRQASSIFDEVQSSRVEDDVVLQSTAVASLAAGLQWQTGLRDATVLVKRQVSGLSAAIASTVLGCCSPNWQAALEFHSLCFAAGLMNQQCTSSTLRTLQLATIWRSAIALLERKPGGDAALVSNLLQTTAAEYLARCFAASDHSATLIYQLCEMRRHVMDRLKHLPVLRRRSCVGSEEGWRSSMENTPEQWYKNLPILTRVLLTVIFGVTVLVQLEFLNPGLLFLNWPMIINKLQVWRLLTPALFFGTFSFQFLLQMYFFTSFSSKLEQNEVFSQPGDYLFFLLAQILLLDVISLALMWPSGFPTLGPPLVFAILYYWSRREPYARLSFFSFTIQGYQFPFALIFFQLLIGGNIWMDLLGLASGHIYYFLAEVVPQEYGYVLVKTPAFLSNFMARYAAPGVAANRPAATARPQPTNFGGGGQRLGGNCFRSQDTACTAARRQRLLSTEQRLLDVLMSDCAARDECITMNGEEKCKAFIEAHKQCLRAEGFDVKFNSWEEAMKTPAELRLKSGERWRGFNFGAKRSIAGEVVFCTAMMGYPESLTDPSFEGQILVLTYPIVGNYGVPADDKDEQGIPRYFEGSRIYPVAVVVSEYSFAASHYSAVKSLSQWLEQHNVPGISGVDTRAITKRLRQEGSALGAVVVGSDAAPQWEDPNLKNLVAQVSVSSPTLYQPARDEADEGEPPLVVAVDCGMKLNIVRYFIHYLRVRLKVVPWDYDFSKEEFDGLFISNGPGDPEKCEATVNCLRKVMQERPHLPIFGICLGHQLLSLAAGCKTYKMKFGNRGVNQPCVDLRTGRCYITSQNHGFAVDDSKLPDGWRTLFTNANDGSNEGIGHKEKPWFSVQFHPEACCGPVDTAFLFDDFFKILRNSGGRSLTTISYKHPQAISKVLVLGSGGLTIGQAGEFDYSGSQAIKALREQHVQSVLINPNIATVQTSRGLADQIYFVPVTPEFVTKVIDKVRPDGLFAAFGGQTALNCAVALHRDGTLKKYGVKVLGTQIDSIVATEDREIFKEGVESLGEKCAQSACANTFEEARKVAREIGFPVLVRAAFALGGLGSGFASNE